MKRLMEVTCHPLPLPDLSTWLKGKGQGMGISGPICCPPQGRLVTLLFLQGHLAPAGF